VEKIAVAPRKILGLPVPEIKAGARAEMTVFHPDMEWRFDAHAVRSKSKNTPLLGQTFRGYVAGIINNGQAIKNNGTSGT
jgi:dihydroorotase